MFVLHVLAGLLVSLNLSLNLSLAAEGDRATHDSDHDEDVVLLPPVHVHGIPLNKDQQLGPVPTHTPWPAIPPVLEGKVIDDWMKARFMVATQLWSPFSAAIAAFWLMLAALEVDWP